jgi:hypothetical protein
MVGSLPVGRISLTFVESGNHKGGLQMRRVIFKSELDFLENCPCAYKILNFVDSIEDTDVRWFFDYGVGDYDEKTYQIIFKSYITPEFKDYVLSIKAEWKDGTYDIKLVKKVDNLLADNG